MTIPSWNLLPMAMLSRLSNWLQSALALPKLHKPWWFLTMGDKENGIGPRYMTISIASESHWPWWRSWQPLIRFCVTCAINNSLQASIATCFVVHMHPFDRNWEKVVLMEEMEKPLELQNRMAYSTWLRVIGGSNWKVED